MSFYQDFIIVNNILEHVCQFAYHPEFGTHATQSMGYPDWGHF